MSRPNVFHLVAGPDWDSALVSGRYAPASLEAEGFVHFSEEHQVAATAQRHYAGRVDLVVVEFDPDRLGGELIDEDLAGRGESYPHLYGPVPTSAAVFVHPLSDFTERGGG